MSQPTAGATTAIADARVAGGFVVTTCLLTGESAICESKTSRGARSHSHSDNDELFLHSTSYFGTSASHQHIDLAADAKSVQVHARLDGKATVRQDAALVVNLQVVHVGAVGVHLGAYRVPGTMHKIFSVAGLGDA